MWEGKSKGAWAMGVSGLDGHPPALAVQAFTPGIRSSPPQPDTVPCQRAEAASLLDDRMYRIFINTFAEWGVLGEWLRGEPTFEDFARIRG